MSGARPPGRKPPTMLPGFKASQDATGGVRFYRTSTFSIVYGLNLLDRLLAVPAEPSAHINGKYDKLKKFLAENTQTLSENLRELDVNTINRENRKHDDVTIKANKDLITAIKTLIQELVNLRPSTTEEHILSDSSNEKDNMLQNLLAETITKIAYEFRKLEKEALPQEVSETTPTTTTPSPGN